MICELFKEQLRMDEENAIDDAERIETMLSVVDSMETFNIEDNKRDITATHKDGNMISRSSTFPI